MFADLLLGGEGLIRLLVYVVVICLVAGLVVWLLESIPRIPPELKQFARVAVIVIACIAIILLLLRLV